MPPSLINTTTAAAEEKTPHKRPSGSGPIVGIVIIVFLMIVGALYFWGAALGDTSPDPLPLIPGDSASS